jgi:hypothetical protein
LIFVCYSSFKYQAFHSSRSLFTTSAGAASCFGNQMTSSTMMNDIGSGQNIIRASRWMIQEPVGAAGRRRFTRTFPADKSWHGVEEEQQPAGTTRVEI